MNDWDDNGNDRDDDVDGDCDDDHPDEQQAKTDKADEMILMVVATFDDSHR